MTWSERFRSLLLQWTNCNHHTVHYTDTVLATVWNIKKLSRKTLGSNAEWPLWIPLSELTIGALVLRDKVCPQFFTKHTHEVFVAPLDDRHVSDFDEWWIFMRYTVYKDMTNRKWVLVEEFEQHLWVRRLVSGVSLYHCQRPVTHALPAISNW